ncbi:hypothetical protein [Rathayibacter rathayi]|uniref:hypothetical protein n=1 Tax=Rathayibacter rathayi TaxID=33887 RepID=UPI0015E2F1DC|nr:hypothetical protein [Rathayibacter rathayi]
MGAAALNVVCSPRLDGRRQRAWTVGDNGPSRSSYRSAVPPRIAAPSPGLQSDTLDDADEAARELSRLDAELGAGVIGFAPVLPRPEASSSSKIENLTASARSVFSAEFGACSGRNAELIVANTRAMSAALELSQRSARH